MDYECDQQLVADVCSDLPRALVVNGVLGGRSQLAARRHGTGGFFIESAVAARFLLA